MIKFLPLLLLALFGSACIFPETVESTRVPAAEIRQTYHIAADRDGTHVSAVFYHGDKTVDLDGPSRIEHNGGELPQISPGFFKGTTYERRDEIFAPRHAFVYTDGEGRTFRNELVFQPVEIKASGLEISRSRETSVPLSRDVEEGERVTVTLVSLEKRPADDAKKPNGERLDELTLNDELDDARTAVVLKPKNLKNFTGGRATLKIEVSRELPLQQATPAGGSRGWSYTSTIETRVID